MTAPLLHVRHLSKHFRLGNQILRAVQDISFSLSPGEILGLGGESGCGKSTVGKLLMGLLTLTTGSIFFDGQDLSNLMSRKSKAWRQKIQMIFQHPAASLNPRMTVEETLIEPFVIHGLAKGMERSKRIMELLTQVGLAKEHLKRLPHELSGGQKQRVAIARALAVNPLLLICDEPFSALDVSVQAQIINLLSQLQREQQLSYLIISHDLSILRYLTHRLAIMYLGQLMEWGPTHEVYDHPLHPYTQGLRSAVLLPDPFKKRQKMPLFLKDELPSLVQPPQGCPFYARCPFAQAICQKVKPEWQEVKTNHFIACHLY
jgi:peptide/nickel transport system ATP-binding protein/oligopeptide transport system ATP-binding protein